ncbi:hypothetical protein KY289_005352 [Solanum tuberosum]|nr:hypothetical protein KY289_005352 [Solanum tuberosum]
MKRRSLKRSFLKKEAKRNNKNEEEESFLELVGASGPTSNKGPSSLGKKRKFDKLLSHGERIEILSSQKVLNRRVFDMEIMTKPGMESLVDAVEIQSWTHLFTAHVPVLHKSKVKEFYYKMKLNEDESLNAHIRDIQFHVNEAILGEILQVPLEGIITIVGKSSSKDFVLQINKLLNQSCAGIQKKYLKSLWNPIHGVRETMKQTIFMNTLIECECGEGKNGNKIVEQSQHKHELETMKVTLGKKDVEIIHLKVKLQSSESEGLGGAELTALKVENKVLADKNIKLKARFFRLIEEAYARLSFVLKYLTSKPSSSRPLCHNPSVHPGHGRHSRTITGP